MFQTKVVEKIFTWRRIYIFDHISLSSS